MNFIAETTRNKLQERRYYYVNCLQVFISCFGICRSPVSKNTSCGQSFERFVMILILCSYCKRGFCAARQELSREFRRRVFEALWLVLLRKDRGEDCIFRGYIDSSGVTIMFYIVLSLSHPVASPFLLEEQTISSRFEYCFADFLRDDPFHSVHNAIFERYVRLRDEELVPTIELRIMSPHSRCNSAAKNTLFSRVSRACLFEGRARVLSLLRESLVDTYVRIHVHTRTHA